MAPLGGMTDILTIDPSAAGTFDELVATLVTTPPGGTAAPVVGAAAAALPRSHSAFDLLDSATFATRAAVAPVVAATPEGGRLRCIDGTHAPGCRVCKPAPPEGDESLYELSGELGKKNGEKRLRSQLSRTAEWGSIDERARVAALCDGRPDKSRLAAALRARHCAELRKADLMFLARLWGYASDVWSRRKDRRYVRRRYAPRAGGAPAPPPPVTTTPGSGGAVATLPQASAAAALAWDRSSIDTPALQLAAVHAQMSGPLRMLAERSLAAFSFADGPNERLVRLLGPRRGAGGGTSLSPTMMAVAAETFAQSSSELCTASARLTELLTALSAQHAEVQVALLRLPLAERQLPAFVALSGAAPPAWEALLRDAAALCDYAILCGKQGLGPVAAEAARRLADESEASMQSAESSANTSVCGAAVLSSAHRVRPSGCDADAASSDAEMLQFLSDALQKESIGRGGLLALELVTRITAMLSQLKLATHEAYLHASSLALGLLVGHLTAVSSALARHTEHVREAGRMLAAAGALPVSAAAA